MALYAIAFVAFALDLARRSSEATQLADARAGVRRTTTAASVGGGGTAVLEAAPPAPPLIVSAKRTAARVGVGITIAGFVLHLGADVLRGVAAARVPWANMYEFSMTGTLIMVGLFLLALTRVDLRFLGSIMTGLVLVLLGIATIGFKVPVSPLPPALQSYWLVIHVFVAILGTGFFTLSGAVSAVQLVQSRRERALAAGRPATRLRLLATFPDTNRLENIAYRIAVVGFILWTFTLIAGAIWANHAWGRYWGWDTKEVWTFIIWVIYAGYLHARATRGWRGDGSGWLNLIGYAAVLFNFGVVNVFFHGLHAYSGLSS
ncbi:c-type cytochrome biogenesis protein CcsB [Amnibacterium sp. CER49]|uniref:c-type cytochrome biogenesis protein CcsB n=1 Tax=Amnibacterium sp. CER49 TaxID=3039161 RepID=UPI002447A938|nr:c-type cytochrome biogenesis protein CcsB [Amnibacterium sp. CER49]MDH2443416.1 c-type cytochrome biogenesis protein CcsB [Amnibacterium sp. CER49]